MKVLSVCTNLPSLTRPQRGLFIARRLSEMARLVQLQALNPEPWFPFLKPAPAETSSELDGFRVDVRRMPYLPAIAKQFDGRWMKRTVDRWLKSLGEKSTKNAILDAHFGYPDGVGCYLAARQRRMKVFITIRGLEIDLFNHPQIGRQLIDALNGADGVIAVSQSLRCAAIDAGVAPGQIVVIPNGVDPLLFGPGDRNQARIQLGIPYDQKLIVSIGNIKRVKGHDVLINALATMPGQCMPHLACIGNHDDAAWFNHLQRQVDRLGIGDRVRFLGSQPTEEVATWLRAADLFALASHREGCCNAVLESLSTGTPVVTTTAGDNGLYIQPGVSGYLSEPADASKLAANLAAGLNHRWFRESISYSMQSHSWERTARQVVNFFQQGNCEANSLRNLNGVQSFA